MRLFSNKVVFLVTSSILLFLSTLSVSCSSHIRPNHPIHHRHHGFHHLQQPRIERKYSSVEYDKDMLESVLKEVINDEISKLKREQQESSNDRLTQLTTRQPSLPQPINQISKKLPVDLHFPQNPTQRPGIPHPMERKMHEQELNGQQVDADIQWNLDPSKLRNILGGGEREATNVNNNNNNQRDLREELLLLEEKLRHEKSIRQKLEQQEQRLREEKLLQERLREERRKIEQLLAEEKSRREMEEVKKVKYDRQRHKEQEVDFADSLDLDGLKLKSLTGPDRDDDKWTSSDLLEDHLTSLRQNHPFGQGMMPGRPQVPFGSMRSFSSPLPQRLPPFPPFPPRVGGSFFPPVLRSRHHPLPPIGSFPPRPFGPMGAFPPAVGPFPAASTMTARFIAPPQMTPASMHSMAANLYPGVYANALQRSSDPMQSIKEEQKDAKKNIKSMLMDLAVNSILDVGVANIAGAILKGFNTDGRR